MTSNYPPEIGGPAKFSMDFYNWLASKSINSSVISTSPNMPFFQKKNNIFLVSRKLPWIVRLLFLFIALLKEKNKASIIVVGLFYETLFANLILGFKYVAKVPSDIVWDRARNNQDTELSVNDFQSNLVYKYRILRFLFTKSLERAEKIIVPSIHLRNLVNSWGINNSKIFVIRNSASSNPKFISYPEKYDLIYAGRFIELKQIDEIIFACSNLNLSILLLGDGPELNKIKELAEQMSVNARFEGAVSNEEVQEKIQMSKVFVLNSRHEGSPNSLIEAMALGSVCVVRSNQGVDEIIDDLENGVLVSPKRSLTESINIAINDSNLREKLKNNAKKTIEKKFNRERNYREILQKLNEKK